MPTQVFCVRTAHVDSNVILLYSSKHSDRYLGRHLVVVHQTEGPSGVGHPVYVPSSTAVGHGRI
jgi:hypothetical protein